jgi:hypothetical protein
MSGALHLTSGSFIEIKKYLFISVRMIWWHDLLAPVLSHLCFFLDSRLYMNILVNGAMNTIKFGCVRIFSSKCLQKIFGALLLAQNFPTLQDQERFGLVTRKGELTSNLCLNVAVFFQKLHNGSVICLWSGELVQKSWVYACIFTDYNMFSLSFHQCEDDLMTWSFCTSVVPSVFLSRHQTIHEYSCKRSYEYEKCETCSKHINIWEKQ